MCRGFACEFNCGYRAIYFDEIEKTCSLPARSYRFVRTEVSLDELFLVWLSAKPDLMVSNGAGRLGKIERRSSSSPADLATAQCQRDS